MAFLPRPRKDADAAWCRGVDGSVGPNGGEITAAWIGGELIKSLRLDLMSGARCYTCIATLEPAMLALRLPAQIEKRLDSLAKKTGRSKSFYAREAILRHLEDLEDYHLARRRLTRKATRVTLEQLEREQSATR